MAERHPILYEFVRWQRFRNWLLLPATGCSIAGIILSLRSPAATSAAQNFFVVAAGLYALATSIWLRRRFSFVEFDGENVRIRMMGSLLEIPVDQVRRARVTRLLAALDKPERRRYLPRPRRRWEDAEALVLRVTGVDAQRVRRIVGRRCVFDDELVIPVGGAEDLRKQLEPALRRATSDAAEGPARKHRRRKKR